MPDSAPILSLRHLSKRFGDFAAVDDLSLDIAAGEFLTLLGASGSGKTTTLRMIAGFEQPSGGEILMAGAPIAALPPFKRDINTVFQHYALFPHMSVRDNVGYGLRMRGVPAAERAERVTRALAMVKLDELGGRSPRQLSGGQQQRVALARALVNRPRVLLLDEPLGALDLKLRKEMQLELKHLQTSLGITFVYVTHDQEEALTMSDRIVLMREGRIEQIGTPRDLYDRPASRYVADFIGDTNLLPGKVAASEGGVVTLRTDDATLRGVSDGVLPEGVTAWLTVRPEAIRLAGPAELLDGENVVEGTVSDAVYAGSALRVHVALPSGHRLVANVPSASGVTNGAPARLAWPVPHGRCVRD
ncbi:MAG TPA: ABC transporter ATP-binding protein [Gemmatimonadales bacterium]|nr:ABC transporter ATP-binding protein [Gemmatimonadales bacterium]